MEKIGINNGPSGAIELFFGLNKGLPTLLLLVQTVIFGPIAEELLFRGFLFKALRNKYPFAVSAGISSLIFSLLHLEPGHILPLFVIGMALSYLYERTQNITSPIIFHTLFNGLNTALVLILRNT